MKPYTVETLSLIVKPIEEAIYSELATVVTLKDEGGGPFVEVTQPGLSDGYVWIEPTEWPAVKSAIDALMNRVQWHTSDDPDDDEDDDEVAEDDDDEEEERPDEWLCSNYPKTPLKDNRPSPF